MKKLLLALLMMHIGCATVSSETQPPTAPSNTRGNGPATGELLRRGAGPGAAREAEPTFAVVGGNLMMTDPGASSQPIALWPIAETPVLWTRFVSLGAGGYAVALRQRDAILVGTLSPHRSPLGELSRIPVRHVIGEPTVAASGEVAIVIWAQGERSGCTSLVGATLAPGEGPGPVHRIQGTECNEERSARAPVLGTNAEGGFVLSFTEIGVWSSQAVAMEFNERNHTLSLLAP